MGATGLAADPTDYRARLQEQTDEQIDAWASELMRDVAIRRGVLTVIADLLGLIGGYAVAHLLFGVDTNQYWTSVWQTLVFRGVFAGLIKPVLFGFIIATMGCYYGMATRGGTQGVGRSTTQAVVASSVLILIVDFFVTKLIFAIFGYS